MARARTIKLGFFTNDQLGELPMGTRLVFAGLWPIADREGRLLDRPKKIKAEVMPYDDIDVDCALQQLADAGFVLRYQVDGQACIQIVNWSKHQNPHPREAPSEIPPPLPLLDQQRLDNGATASPPLLGREKDVTSNAGLRSPVSGSLAGPLTGRAPEGSSPGAQAREETAASPPAGHNDDQIAPTTGYLRQDVQVDSELAAYVDARARGFADDDPERTKLSVQRLWTNSRLDRQAFFEIFHAAVAEVKAAQIGGTLMRDDDGRQKGWPLCLTLLRERLPAKTGRANGARAGPDPTGHTEQHADKRPASA